MERYDLNHSKGIPLIPHCAKREIRMLWSTVSKAAVKSRSRSTAGSPESVINKISLSIFKRAVSVLWWVLKPDWNFSKIL